jgi:ribose 5-phosphate isomerase B
MKNDITIVLAADHAGFELKETIKNHLVQKGRKVSDVGAETLIPGDDYPSYMRKAAELVCKDLNDNTVAIIFGGSGEGEAMVANRFPGVRATVWYGGNLDIIKLSREHNNANILSIGARMVTASDAIEAVDLWLSTTFSGEERHVRRIADIDNFE